MSVTCLYRYVCYKMNVFFYNLLINHLPKIYRSILHKITVYLLDFWGIYDVNLWEKLAITVRLCFIETRLKQDHDLQGYFLKITRERINVLTIKVVIFLNEHLVEAVVQRCSSKKLFLKFCKFTAKDLRLWPASLLKKRLYLQVFKLLRTPLFMEYLRWLNLVFSFK